MFWIGIAKKTQRAAASKITGHPRYLWGCWETCPLGLIYLHYNPSIWETDFPKKQDHTLTALLNRVILRPQPTCDPVNHSDTLLCAKKVGLEHGMYSSPQQDTASAKATSESSCQVYPHKLPAFSTLIILSVSASYSYLKAPVGKRQSWEKDIIPPFRPDLKTSSQASTFVVTPISNLCNNSLG